MVLYENVCLNQKVEVLWKGRLENARVRFKGYVNGVRGEWVGVEFSRRVGDCNGMYKARRYFHCMDYFGALIPASQIRFKPLLRVSLDTYKVVSPISESNDYLFGKHRCKSPVIEYTGSKRISELYSDKYREEEDDSRQFFHRPHSVGNHLPISSRKSVPYKYPTMMTVYGEREKFVPDYGIRYLDDGFDFISSPSIPMTHMYHSALKEQVRKGWENSHYVRRMSVNTGREEMKYNTWNDVS